MKDRLGSFSNINTKETFIRKTFSWLVYNQDLYLGSCSAPSNWERLNTQKKERRKYEPRTDHPFNGQYLGQKLSKSLRLAKVKK